MKPLHTSPRSRRKHDQDQDGIHTLNYIIEARKIPSSQAKEEGQQKLTTPLAAPAPTSTTRINCRHCMSRTCGRMYAYARHGCSRQMCVSPPSPGYHNISLCDSSLLRPSELAPQSISFVPPSPGSARRLKARGMRVCSRGFYPDEGCLR